LPDLEALGFYTGEREMETHTVELMDKAAAFTQRNQHFSYWDARELAEACATSHISAFQALVDAGGVPEESAYDLSQFQQDMREAVITAIDGTASDADVPTMVYTDLSEIYQAIDALAEKLWARSSRADI